MLSKESLTSLQDAPLILINIEKDLLWSLGVGFNYQIVASVSQVLVTSHSMHLQPFSSAT